MNQGHRFLVGSLIAVVLGAALILVVVGGQGAMAADTIIYVDADAIGENNGTSWGDAYIELQPALEAAADGDEIWVAAGIYAPTAEHGGTGDRYRSFQMKNWVAIYGGFDPSVGDIAWEDRDWEVNPTILSGDLNGDDGLDFENNSDNSYHVFYHPEGLDLDSTAMLDGFTVTGGNADGDDPHYRGGGMHNDHSSPALANCTFSGNSAEFPGGGLYNHNSSPVLINCAFVGNQAYDGGGMYNSNTSSPALIGCTFSVNSAYSLGGGIHNLTSSPMLTNCTFSGNSADGDGGAMSNLNASSPMLTNCTFSGNFADGDGGAISNLNASSPMLTNCVLWEDSPQEIFSHDEASSPVVAYSDILGGCDANPFNVCGDGNINADPLFVDAAAGDLRLQYASPAIDAGDNDAPALAGVTTDRDGNPRFVDVIAVVDTGNGDPPIVDMGAYEALPGVIFVDEDATGANNGSSWNDAYTTLQPALEAAAAREQIWVAEGTYIPTWQFDTADPRSATFQLRNDVAIYGGFDPSVDDIAWEDRDWVTHETILSGDLNGDDGPDFENNGENSYHVFYHPEGTWLDSSAVLDGFTITSGNADSTELDDYGREMYSNTSSPTLAESAEPGDCGGGMYNDTSSPTLANLTFTRNWAYWFGGGMANQVSSPQLTHCTFEDNSAGILGGGIYNRGSSPELTHCIFAGNSAGYNGGGMSNYASSPTLANCTFTDNSAKDYGGGIHCEASSSPVMTNCTFSGNSAREGGGGGGVYSTYSSPTLTNCILWGDTPDEIYEQYDDSLIIYSSDIQGGYAGTGNINEDPLFLDPDNGDFHLLPDSPCIDAGTNGAEGLPAYDFEGDDRILDGDGDGEAIVDMGVDEAFWYPPVYLPVVLRGY